MLSMVAGRGDYQHEKDFHSVKNWFEADTSEGELTLLENSG